MFRPKYFGVFFDEASIKGLMKKEFPDTVRLSRPIKTPHVTFGYQMDMPYDFMYMVGKRVLCDVVGYAKDEENEGLQIKFSKLIMMLYHNNAPVHMTVSVGKNGRPRNTGKLCFEACDGGTMEGRIGYFGTDDRVHFVLPEEED